MKPVKDSAQGQYPLEFREAVTESALEKLKREWLRRCEWCHKQFHQRRMGRPRKLCSDGCFKEWRRAYKRAAWLEEVAARREAQRLEGRR